MIQGDQALPAIASSSPQSSAANEDAFISVCLDFPA